VLSRLLLADIASAMRFVKDFGFVKA